MSLTMVTKRDGRSRAVTRAPINAGRLAAAVAAVLCAQRRAAFGIVVRDDVDPAQYVNLAAQSAYAASGYIDILTSQSGNTSNYNFESATLIAPDWIITAAHGLISSGTTNTFAPSAITFGQGATATFPTSSSVVQVRIESGFNGDLTQGNDLALVQLSTPITSIAPAPIYPTSLGTLQGQTAAVVGYGDTGTGISGYVAGSLGTRRAMQNVLDTFGGQSTSGGADGNTPYNFGGFSPSIVFSDFDSPNSANWSATNLMGDPAPLALEGATAPGDSGGGAFVTVNGQTYLAAVTSFGYNFNSNNPLSQYGDANGFSALTAASAINFLSANLAVSSAWASAGGGTWASLSSWNNANIPEFAKASANFGSSATAPATVTLDASWTVGTITFNNSNSYTIASGNGGSLTLDGGKPSATVLLTDTSGSHFITAPINLISNLRATITNSGDVLTLSGPITGKSNLSVQGNGTLRFGAGVSTPTFAALSINTGATLDITTNAVVINFGSPANDPVSTVAGYLAGGYKGGLWTGTGITSSTAAAGANPALAVGYADGNTDNGTPAQPNTLLIKYTLAGDANLDGLVNFQDLVAVVQNFNKSGTDWSQGNFAYGASTNFADLVAVVQNFNKILTPAFTAGDQLGGHTIGLGFSATISPTAIQLPEPSALLVMGISTAALSIWRRRASGQTISGRTD